MTVLRPIHWPLRISAAIAIVFGLMSIIAGGSVLFGGADVRAAAGNVVAMVLWFNFLSGFAYVAAGVGIAMGKPWAALLSIGLATAIAVVFALFGLHVLRGGAYEGRTAAAMLLRLVVWVTTATVVMRSLPPRSARR